MNSDSRGRDKVKRAAALSVLAALLLTLMKIVVGLITNSLGVISEALHSGLDLIAAGITFIAVKRASEGPDLEHPYGHGKIENFAALAETILLWITSAWIIYEAFRRIIGEEFIEPNIWAIIVMLVSIFVDYERSQMLYKTAHAFNSQALEADALHFRTDMLSSVVVLIGLIFVQVGFPIGDSLGALGVSIIILFVSYNLGRRSFDYLVDRAPEGIKETVIETCSKIPGVVDCSQVRARTSGPDLFVDVVITVDETVTTSEAHNITESIEAALSDLAPVVDVVVHVEPTAINQDQFIKFNIYEKLQVLIRRESDIKSVHNIRLFSVGPRLDIAADLEMSPNLTLEEAHMIADTLEQKIKNVEPRIKSVTFHLETAAEQKTAKDITKESGDMVKTIQDIVEDATSEIICSDITLRKEKSGVSVTIDCSIDGTLALAKSHEISDIIEKRIIESVPDVIYVFVHIEPL
ncbi:cation-efflux pump [Candidatus Thorarchaeota archaeon]|nr:MAG: cation-efflux pump [Candidatus Thorarchaeota archaeon]